MKKITLLLFAFATLSSVAQTKAQTAIDQLLTKWHKAAAEAKFDAYFNVMAKDAIYIGTDPTENWTVEAFKAYAKPYFDKGKAWNFKAGERHIFVSGDIAWFNELLDTQMKICQGSGVLRLENGEWKIVQYVLSMTVPNDHMTEVVNLKKDFDDALLAKIKK